MDDIRSLLARHSARYPAMQPRDAVKLLYQRRFGCGHLVEDPAGTLDYLRQELADTPPDPAQPLCEDIGGGFVRVHLAAMEANGLTAETLNAVFCESAKLTGSMEAFLRDLDELAACADLFSFPEAELASYLAAYRAEGCPAVRHSEDYRAQYAPAYRVVSAAVLQAACPAAQFVLY